MVLFFHQLVTVDDRRFFKWNWSTLQAIQLNIKLNICTVVANICIFSIFQVPNEFFSMEKYFQKNPKNISTFISFKWCPEGKWNFKRKNGFLKWKRTFQNERMTQEKFDEMLNKNLLLKQWIFFIWKIVDHSISIYWIQKNCQRFQRVNEFSRAFTVSEYIYIWLSACFQRVCA